jgi:hypothetical protein
VVDDVLLDELGVCYAAGGSRSRAHLHAAPEGFARWQDVLAGPDGDRL